MHKVQNCARSTMKTVLVIDNDPSHNWYYVIMSTRSNLACAHGEMLKIRLGNYVSNSNIHIVFRFAVFANVTFDTEIGPQAIKVEQVTMDWVIVKIHRNSTSAMRTKVAITQQPIAKAGWEHIAIVESSLESGCKVRKIPPTSYCICSIYPLSLHRFPYIRIDHEQPAVHHQSLQRRNDHAHAPGALGTAISSNTRDESEISTRL